MGGAVFGADGRGLAAKFATGGAEGATAIGLVGSGFATGAGEATGDMAWVVAAAVPA